MVIIIQDGASEETIQNIIGKVTELGFAPHPLYGVEKTVVAVIGDKTQEQIDSLQAMPGVERIVPILRPFKLAARTVQPEGTQVDLGGGVVVGGRQVVMMAGPCAIESAEQYLSIGRFVRAAGASVLRGGIFKPRTSPHDFQGLREEGIPILRQVREELGMLLISEVLDPRGVELMHDVVDIFQIGTRNMQNFSLLTECGKSGKPVVIKRGMCATLEDLLKAAEYVLVEGNNRVILCERGIRTFEDQYRSTLDISAVPALKSMSHLPVIVDPSHAAGRTDLVPALCKAAIAAGADGLLVETHCNPLKALVDGSQALDAEQFHTLMDALRPFAHAAGREL
ncbi:MAG: 3-deoxy-7-phosphoheptulonate synthase [candidate division WS1 bacterium]|nr:3-deoxy-7-phosphoheptulonate synthase [candidate division WS1 bacterium]